MLFRNSRLSSHFLLVVTAGLHCAAVLAIGLTIWWLHAMAIKEASRHAGNLATVLAEQTNRSVQSIDLMLNELHERIKVLGAGTQDGFDRLLQNKDIHQLLTERMARLSHIASISLINKNGLIVNSTNHWPMRPIDISDREHFKHIKSDGNKSIYISKPVVDRSNSLQTIFVYKRIDDANNEFLGVISIGIRLSYFQHIYESINSLNNLSFLFLRKDGTVIVRYPDRPNFSGKKLPAKSLWYLLVSAGGGNYRWSGHFDGEARQVAVRPLRDYPLVVNVAVSETAALATWRVQAIIISLGTLLILLCSVFLFRALSKQFRRLATSEAKVDAALNNMSQGLVMFDSAARLIICNNRYRQMMKLPPESVTPGRPMLDIFNDRIANGTFFGNPEQYINDLLAAIALGKTESRELEIGDGRIVSIVNKPMADGGWVATHEDVTEAKRREESFRLLFESNPVPMWVIDRKSLRFLAVNEAAVVHYGYSREQFMAMTVPDLVPAEDCERLTHHLHTLPDVQLTENVGQHCKANGTAIDVAIYSRALNYEGHEARLAVIHDITKVKLVEDELRRTQIFLNTVVEHVPLPILVKDVPNLSDDASYCRFTLVNRAFEEIMGMSRDQMIGRTTYELYPKDRADDIVKHDNKALRFERAVIVYDHSLVTPNNGTRTVNARKVAIRDTYGKPQYLLTVLDDVTERRRAEHRIQHMAHYDTLTDLPNRANFNDTMDATIERAAVSGERFAVLSIDLDRFKEANDTYGHMVGDALLREVARRLQAAAEGAFLARMGGDEFVLIVADGAQPETASALADRLLATFVDDFEVEGQRLKLGMSIGVAIYPTDGADSKALMVNADAALYRAKAETRGTALFYEPEMGTRLRERHDLKEDLRLAVDRGELLLHYQPQTKMSGETVGFEALVRWQCPKRGLVPPGTFIPVAEESGLIMPVGEWVLREACREAASWPQPLTIAVNISPIQFHNGDLPRLIHSILLETGLAPSRLELEITEGVMINDFSRAVSILNQLKSLGIKIAMDDFGTGYSSLSYLQSFRCDKIKIDRVFICDLESNHHSRAIVRAVIGLGQSLNLPILAEGVETQDQHAYLVQEGCDEVQGYLTGRPLPIADYAKLVGHEPITQKNYATAGS